MKREKDYKNWEEEQKEMEERQKKRSKRIKKILVIVGIIIITLLLLRSCETAKDLPVIIDDEIVDVVWDENQEKELNELRENLHKYEKKEINKYTTMGSMKPIVKFDNGKSKGDLNIINSYKNYFFEAIEEYSVYDNNVIKAIILPEEWQINKVEGIITEEEVIELEVNVELAEDEALDKMEVVETETRKLLTEITKGNSVKVNRYNTNDKIAVEEEGNKVKVDIFKGNSGDKVTVFKEDIDTMYKGIVDIELNGLKEKLRVVKEDTKVELVKESTENEKKTIYTVELIDSDTDKILNLIEVKEGMKNDIAWGLKLTDKETGKKVDYFIRYNTFVGLSITKSGGTDKIILDRITDREMLIEFFIKDNNEAIRIREENDTLNIKIFSIKEQIQMIEIYRNDTNELIYKSNAIRMNSKIEYDTLDVDLPKGIYECTAAFIGVHPDTHVYLGRGQAIITIVVNN